MEGVWKQIEQKKKFFLPSHRKNFTIVYYKPKNWFVLFGGELSDRLLFFNDTHIFDLNTKQWIEVNIKINTELPERFGHNSIIYDQFMVVIGGNSEWIEKRERFNDVWFFNLEKLTWKKIIFTNENGSSIKPRAYSSSVLYNHKMIVFGGLSNKKATNDLTEFNLLLKTWKEIELKGDYPTPIFGHSSVIYKDLMFILICKGRLNGKDYFSDKLYQLDLNDYIWKTIDIQNHPKPRWDHNLHSYQNNLIVLGGQSRYGKEDNMFIYNLKDREWKLYNNDSPPACDYCSILKDHQIYIFTAESPNSSSLQTFSIELPGQKTLFSSFQNSKFLKLTDINFIGE